MLILAALFLFGMSDITQEEMKIMTVVIVLLLSLTFLLSIASVFAEVWRLLQVSLTNDSNIQITSSISYGAKDSHEFNSGPHTALENFLSSLTSSFAKEFVRFELLLYSKYHDSVQLESIDHGEPIGTLRDDISQQVKFLSFLSRSIQLGELPQSIDHSLQYQMLKKALDHYPEWLVCSLLVELLKFHGNFFSQKIILASDCDAFHLY